MSLRTHTFKVFSYPIISWMCEEGCRGFWEWNINRSGGILWSPSSERPLAHGNDLILITANKKDKLSFCSPQGPWYQLSHHAVSLSLFLLCVCVWDFSRSGKWGEKIYWRRGLERRVKIRLFTQIVSPSHSLPFLRRTGVACGFARVCAHWALLWGGVFTSHKEGLVSQQGAGSTWSSLLSPPIRPHLSLPHTHTHKVAAIG